MEKINKLGFHVGCRLTITAKIHSQETEMKGILWGIDLKNGTLSFEEDESINHTISFDDIMDYQLKGFDQLTWTDCKKLIAIMAPGDWQIEKVERDHWIKACKVWTDDVPVSEKEDPIIFKRTDENGIQAYFLRDYNTILPDNNSEVIEMLFSLGYKI